MKCSIFICLLQAAASSSFGVFNVGQSLDVESQELEFTLSPPLAGPSSPPAPSLPPPPSVDSALQIVPMTTEDQAQERASRREAARRTAMAEGSSGRSGSSSMDLEVIIERHQQMSQREEEERRRVEEQVCLLQEARKDYPCVPHDPATASDTGSDGEPTIAVQLRTEFEQQPEAHTHSVPLCHPLHQTARAPPRHDVCLSSSSDSYSSDAYPDPTDRRAVPKSEQKVPRMKRIKMDDKAMEQEGREVNAASSGKERSDHSLSSQQQHHSCKG